MTWKSLRILSIDKEIHADALRRELILKSLCFWFPISLPSVADKSSVINRILSFISCHPVQKNKNGKLFRCSPPIKFVGLFSDEYTWKMDHQTQYANIIYRTCGERMERLIVSHPHAPCRYDAKPSDRWLKRVSFFSQINFRMIKNRISIFVHII